MKKNFLPTFLAIVFAIVPGCKNISHSSITPHVQEDSLSTENTNAHVYHIEGATHNIENNTQFGFKQWLGLIGTLFAAFASGFAVYYGAETYKSQKKTEENTRNAPIEYQKERFNDLIRHFYRNLIVTVATKLVLNKTGRQPSESHLLKLKVLPEDEANVDTKFYGIMHELKLLFRNYDTEIDVTLSHLNRKGLTIETINRDIDTLIFKPLYLTNRIIGFEIDLNTISNNKQQTKSTLTAKAISIIIAEHLKKLSENISNIISPACVEFIEEIKNFEEWFLKPSSKEIWAGATNQMITLINNLDDTLKRNDVAAFLGEDGIKIPSSIILIAPNIEENKKEQFLSLLNNQLRDYYTLMSKSEWNKPELIELINYVTMIDLAIEKEKIQTIKFMDA